MISNIICKYEMIEIEVVTLGITQLMRFSIN